MSVDEEVWLTPEGVVTGTDDVADAAINWINTYTEIKENNFRHNDPDIHLNIFPNPFTRSTTIEYELFMETNVEIKICDLFGKEVKTLNKSTQKPGNYSFVWNGTNKLGKPISTGIYFCTLQAGLSNQSIKIIKTIDE